MPEDSPAYEYHGLMAETWDLFRGDTSGWEDRRLYREAVERFGQPVLDLGCGTGRILLDFLAEGIDIDGVDNSPEMLELLGQKAAAAGLEPRAYLGEMQTLELPRQYALILVPSSSFQLLVEPEDARAAMHRFREHLLPGGTLLMPFMRLWQPTDPLERPWNLTAKGIRTGDGAAIRRWSRTWFDPTTGLEHTEDRYDVLVDDVVVHSELHVRSPAVKDYDRASAEALYVEAGLVNVHSLHGFTWEPAQPDDWLVTVLGERPRP